MTRFTQGFITKSGLFYPRARYYDPALGRFISPDPFLGRLAEPSTQNRYVYVKNNPLGWVDPSGRDWFRPMNHPYTAGREGTVIEPGPTGICRYIDDHIPAGHTFALRHDKFVDEMVNKGFPDWLVNIPTMPAVYMVAVSQEVLNSIYRIFGINTFAHNINDNGLICRK